MDKTFFAHITKGALDGSINFPTAINILMEHDVEAYHVDLIRQEKTFFLANGQSHRENFILPLLEIQLAFNHDGVIQAIKDAQASKGTYIEFLQQIAHAGSNYYIVYISRKKVIYFGRKGDFHIENFPNN